MDSAHLVLACPTALDAPPLKRRPLDRVCRPIEVGPLEGREPGGVWLGRLRYAMNREGGSYDSWCAFGGGGRNWVLQWAYEVPSSALLIIDALANIEIVNWT